MRAGAGAGNVGRVVLFLWLTINVDLVIFADVLFGIRRRRTADVPRVRTVRIRARPLRRSRRG